MIVTPPNIALNTRPTTVVCVDDDRTYLKTLSNYFSYLNISHMMFTNPNKAIKFLQDSVSDHYWLSFCLEVSDDDDEQFNIVKAKNIVLNIDRLADLIYQPNRFLEVSCACFDHKMPEKTGVETIEVLKHMPFKKALLSEQFPVTEAINEFNKQTFDIFVNKHNDQAIDELTCNIKRAETVYFKECTKQLVEHHDKLQKVFSNPQFEKFFAQFIADNHIFECYSIDDLGSFLLLDKNAKAQILAVIHDDDMEAYYQTALMAEKKPNQTDLDRLKKRAVFPFFYHQDTYNILPNKWDKYLLNAKRIPETDIYYAVVSDVKKYGIDTSKVVSYADFLAKQDPFELV